MRYILFLIIIIGIGIFLFQHRQSRPQHPALIGGDRDSHGCLGPAGYTWDETVGACIRKFEMTPDIMKAAKMAVDRIGQSNGLTVVSFNSYEETGSYDIALEQTDQSRVTVYIRKWNIQEPRTVRLYYYDSAKDTDTSGNIQCTKAGLVAVERTIPVTQTPIQDTIRLLLSGNLTAKDRALGIATEYPLEGFSLVDASLKNGVLRLRFEDPQNKTSGGSCRAVILWAQIEATAKQFPEVTSVVFEPTELFQP